MKTFNRARVGTFPARPVATRSLVKSSPRAPRAGWFAGFWLALVLILAIPARAGVSVDLRMFFYGSGYFAFPRLSFNDTTANPPNTGYFAWGPTSTQTSGIHYELYPGGSISGGSSVYNPFNNFMAAINGNWTLMVTNTTTTNYFTYTVDASALTSADLPTVTVTYPTAGATITDPSPTFTWQGPADWPGGLNVFVRNQNYSYYQSANLSAAATSWSPPNPLPGGTLVFSARYTTNLATGVNISTPLHDDTSDPFPGWVPSASIETYGEVEFTVSQGGGGHQLVAHYAFDNESHLGQDSSANGHDINAGGSWDVPEHEFSSDSLAGNGAVEFFGFSYLAPPEEVVAPLAGDFTMSVWLKTSQVSGNDDDDARFSVGIVSADTGEDAVVVPLALTGNKAAFYTGSPDGSAQDTLHSFNDINLGDYVHVVVTRSQSSGEKRIYINGQLDTLGTGVAGSLDAATELFDLQVGAGNNGFEGLLDDLQFYSGVLSPTEVAFLYDNPGQSVPDAAGDSLGDAVDAPGYNWITGGDAYWFHQTSTTHDGVDAAQSGVLDQGEESWIETTVTGPGTVSFWLKLSAGYFDDGEDYFEDYLEFSIDGSTWDWFYGEVDWFDYEVSIGPGLHVLRWRYVKDAPCCLGTDDTAWLDQFSFSPDVAPEITFTPADVRVFTGSNVVLNVELYGHPGPDLRWYKDGVLLPTQTTATLALNNAQPSDSGWYYLSASNHLGQASTGNIRVSVFDPTDLYPTSVSVSAIAGSQTLIPISWVVTNTGPGNASNAVDQIYLATNGVNVALIGQMSRAAANAIVPPGGTYTLSNLFRLPRIGAGDYSVRVNVDAFNSMLELNETNNSLASPITIINPDIQPGNVQALLPVVGGLTLQVSYNITNNGPGAIDGASWNDHIVLSTDDQWSEDDLNLLQPLLSPNIPVGQFISRTNTVALPVIASGNYYIVVRADRFGFADHGNLWEVNETNNQAAVAIQLTVPDLVPTNLIAPAQVSPSQPVNIEWHIQNVGDGVATAWNPAFFPKWYDRLYFSTNQFAGPGAVWTGDELGWNTPLPAGEFMTNSRTIEVPNLPEGDYFLVLTSDVGNRVREINENNNQLGVPIRVAYPDLMPTTLLAPAVADAHSAIEVSWAVTNRGAGLAQPIWRDRLYLSSNDTFEATDTLLGEFTRSTVTLAGGTYSQTNSVFLPGVAPGNYFLIFRADARTNLFESIVTNNYLARAINIASPDLVVTALDAPTNVASQQPITVTYSVANVGATTAQPIWYDRAFLSEDTVLDANDVPVGTPNGQTFNFIHNAALPVGNSYTQQLDLRIPSIPAGDYYLLFQTDGTNTFAEVNEANNFFAHALRLNNPDLIPTNLIAPTSLAITQLNQHIEVGWNVLNQDTGTVYVSWSDRVYLSTNNVLDGSAVQIGSETHSFNLGFGESYLAFANPQLPNGIQGQYYLLVAADATSRVYESEENNNVIARPLQLHIPPVPDLAVHAITAPVEALSGQEVEVTWVLTNRGSATAFGPFHDRVYLASTAGGGGLVTYGTFEFTGTIGPGEAVQRVQRINLPLNLSGERWVVVTTDIHNRVFEFDQEGNNTLIAGQSLNVILAPTPNLTVPSVNAPEELFSGQLALVTWAVTNQGTGPTRVPIWFDAVYLSATTNIAGATFLGHVPNAAYLAPGEAYANARVVQIPRGINGTHYFFVRTDYANYVFENADEGDNVTLFGPVNITLTPPPDLRVDAVNPPLSAFSGQSIPVTWAVTNHGLGQTLETRWSDRVYLSLDTTIDGSDYILGAQSHSGGLEPGAGYLGTNSFKLPVGVVGEWYVLIRCDAFNQVYEVPFEANNDGAPAFATTIFLTPPPDLATTILNAPTNARASHVLPVTYRVANDGASITPDSSWLDRLYLSADTNFNAGQDLLVASRSHYGALPPGAAYTNTFNAVLPDGLSGEFHVFVVSDANNTVFELDKTNNLALASNTVTVVSQPADLVVRSLTAPASVQAGTAMLVSWAVTNRSVGDSAVTRWTDRLVLSADDFLGDSDDVTLLNYQRVGLLGGASEYAVDNVLVTIPIAVTPGEYRLFLITDAADNVYEGTNENNNASAPLPIVITRETADLQITEATSPASAAAGTALTVQWRVQNFGSRPPNSGHWTDGVYLSTDEVLSPSDVRLGRRQSVLAPGPGGSYTNTLTAMLPHGLAGDYFLIFVTDEFNQVFESAFEGNNQHVRPLTVTPGVLPDLAVTVVNAPDVGYSGQSFELTWTVQNVGTAPATPNWYDAVYLSLDHFLDPFVDAYVGFRSRPRSLAPGESYTNTASFEIPPGFSGPYYVIVATDSSGTIFEGAAVLNNRGLDPEAMQVQLTPPVDLVAGPITVPANAAPGVNTTISFIVHNLGSNVARGSWEDAIFISADTNYDVGDALFGRVRHVGDVPPGSSYTNTLTAPLPGVLPGDYHVIIRSDILNHLVEPDRTNNVGASLDLVAIDSEVLILGTPANGQIAQGQSVYYKFNATAGDTVRVRFTTGVPLAGNEIYVSQGTMPSRANFQFAVNEPFIADPDLFIAIEQTGAHYLLVFSGAMPAAAPYTILAEVLPFTVATVQPRMAGDRGPTTFKLRGALFAPETKFELVLDTNVLTAAALMLEDSTTAFVTFNLAGRPNGVWHLKASMNETSTVSSTLSNAITVFPGRGPVVDALIHGPLSVWAIFTQPVLLAYGNSGDADALAPLLLVSGVGGTRVGVDRNQLQDEPLQILGRSLDGPSERLRPQASFSHRLVYRGGELHVQVRTVRADSPRVITDADWLEIEASLRPPGAADADWLAFWSNVRPRIGTVWGDYVTFLHHIAAELPAEQRNVREIIGTLFTNQPGFRASSYLSGVVLGATNNLPQVDVGVGFYRVTTNGAAILGGSAVTDINGQFLVPRIQPGQYVVVTDSTEFKDFDMDQDGTADTNAPTFTISGGADLPNQTIYLHQPSPTVVVTNDTDATLITDSRGVLHMMWYRQERLWHAWNDGGTWVDAAPITTSIVGAAAVAHSANLLDGNAPGLIAVWDQAATNRVDLFYSVGQTNGGGYRWSQPVQLTSDLVDNSSPAIVVRPDGLAIIAYLKTGLESADDTDVYYSGVNLVSGELLWNSPAPRPLLAKSYPIKQSLKWAKDLYAKPLGPETEFKFAMEVSGEITRTDCSADAVAAAAFSAKVETDKGFLEGKFSGDLGFGCYVDPDECEWAFREGSAVGNFHGGVTIGFKNVIFRVLEAYPPVRPFSIALEDFMRGFGDFLNVEFENSLELGTVVHLRNVSWDNPPIQGWGFPEVGTADAEVTGAVKFGVKVAGKHDPTNLKINLLDTDPEKPKTTSGTVALQISISAQFYPEWKPQSIKITPTVEVSFPSGWTYSPNVIPELEISLSKPQHYPTFARDTNFLNGTLTHRPETAIGTTNVYGPNSVLADVHLDVLRDGAPALALDNSGVPYQIWFRELDPYGPDYGTELRMADYTGAGWTAPTVIPDTKGINSHVVAATDPLGRRMAIWVHGDASSLTTNMTTTEFFAARDAVNLHYSIFDGANWSAPQPVAPTDGPDSNVQVSTLANGDLLAVWTFNDTNGLIHLLASTWNGTSWTVPQEIATGKIRTPSAQQIANTTYLLWTDTVNTNRNKGLFQSVNVGGTWSVPSRFEAKPAARPAPEPVIEPAIEPTPPLEKGALGAALTALLGVFPDKCCECKGKTQSTTNNVPPRQPCGIALVKYDYEKCQKVYEFKACPLVSMDPNDIVGPEGFGPERWVARGAPMNYTIRFENDALLASAPAKEVIITLPLDPDLDPRTFRLGSFGFGEFTIPVPPDRAFYQTRLDFVAERGFYLDFVAGVDVAKGEAFWRLTTVDPLTGFLPLNPLLGFLPPNLAAPEGEGFVNFSVRPGAATLTGARVDAAATIVFDSQPPIDTPPVFNTVEAGLPFSTVLPLPATTTAPGFLVQWSGGDAPGESGLAGFDIFVSEDSGDYFLWLPDTTLTESPFFGEFGVQYAFYSVARDNAGNVEPAPPTPDTVIFVVAPNTPPVLGPMADQQIRALLPFTLQISVTDTDAPPQTVTFELLEAPAGMTLHAVSGLLSWTPTAAQSGTTNPVTLRATDNGVPPLSATGTFNVVVVPGNTPPVLVPPTNLVVHVLQLARTRVFATDAETNAITFSLGPDAPAAATLDPLTGDFRWTPPLNAAGLEHPVTVLATDDGVPSLSATQQLTITVPHFVWLTLGETNLFTGEMGSVPLSVISSAPWRELGFGLDLPAEAFGQLGLSNVVAAETAAVLTRLDAVRAWLAFSNAPGHELQGTQQLAALVFQADSPITASVPLTPRELAATFADDALFESTLAGLGRVVIVAEQPVLDAIALEANGHRLRLFGNPGETYQIQTATNVTPPAIWLPFTDLVLSNIVQTVDGDTNNVPFRIYRAVKLPSP